MAVELVAVTFDATDIQGLATFWGDLLDRTPTPDQGGLLLPGTDTQVGLRFEPAGSGAAGQEYLHLHLTSAEPDGQQATVDRILELGGRRADVGQLPEEDHLVVADTDGNAFCVIPYGNNFLAGCGFLGEVTCDGSREVGVFWRDALGWELVWDEDGETAVQLPAGGTKLAWGGPPIEPKTGRCRQRFSLAADDPAAEAERLTALGGSVLSTGAGGIELADPDGHEFSIRAR